MKIKQGFTLREVCGTFVVLSNGSGKTDFNGIITLNESAKVLWDALSNDCTIEDMIKALTDVYDVSEEKAKASCEAFLEKLKEADVLE